MPLQKKLKSLGSKMGLQIAKPKPAVGGASSGGNPTSTKTSTKTSTVANPVGNITITGGAGRGATTTVTIKRK